MLGLLLRGVFLVGIIGAYTNGVWKFINDYFRNEYKSYLTDEYKRNQHLRPDADIPADLPPAVIEEDLKESSEDNAKRHLIIESNIEEVKTCDKVSCEDELDYSNQLTEDDRQSRDDDGFINYWLERKSRDNSDNNLHCRSTEATCKDN